MNDLFGSKTNLMLYEKKLNSAHVRKVEHTRTLHPTHLNV